MTQTNPLQADAVVEQRHRDRSAVHHGWTCYQNAALFASSGDMALVDNTAHLLAAFERDYLAIPLQGVEDVRALLAALWATTTEEARKAYADQYGAILAALRPTPSANEIFHGDLPDYDDPMRCVFESGVQYAVELLAKELGVEDYQPCDGTEEFDGDLGGTMMNIVCASLPEHSDGERMWPNEVAGVIAAISPVPFSQRACNGCGNAFSCMYPECKS